jgi:toxin ParE1/3/4
LIEVVWTKRALAQLEAVRVYIERFNPRAATNVAGGLRDAGDSLTHFPLSGRPVRGTGMRELVTDYSYIIRYHIDGDKIVILRIRHTARRPTVP